MLFLDKQTEIWLSLPVWSVSLMSLLPGPLKEQE